MSCKAWINSYKNNLKEYFCNKYLKHNKVGILFSIDITSNNIVKIPLTHFFWWRIEKWKRWEKGNSYKDFKLPGGRGYKKKFI